MRYEDDDRQPSQIEDERLTTDDGADVHLVKEPDGGASARVKLTGKHAQDLLPLVAVVSIVGGPQWILSLSSDVPWWITAPVAVLQLCAISLVARRKRQS